MFLSLSSKQLLSQHLRQVLADTSASQDFLRGTIGKVEEQVGLVRTAEILGEEDLVQGVRSTLSRAYMDEGEHMFHDMTLE